MAIPNKTDFETTVPKRAFPLIRLLIFTRSLNSGGAQRQILELVRGIDKKKFEVTVASFYTGGFYWDELSKVPEIRLLSLGKHSRWDLFHTWRSATMLMKQIQPDIVYSFRNEANLLSIPLVIKARGKLVWGIRRSTKSLPFSDIIALAIFLLGAPLSFLADKVIYNSHIGRTLHIKRCYCKKNAVVIPNGFDTAYFKADPELRRIQRANWGVEDHVTLIGAIGRVVPVKNHELFIRAAARIAACHSDVKFVLVGNGSGDYMSKLSHQVMQAGIGDQFIWAGEMKDMPSCYNALDIMALCSKEEGCSNVLGEAMACGVACVSTDVGDAAIMLGAAGLVVPPEDEDSLVEGLNRLILLSTEERSNVGSASRERILQNYSIDEMIRRTTDTIEDLLCEGKYGR